MKLKYLLPIIALFITFFCVAETVYKQIDSHGNITYTDTPGTDAKAITVGDESSISTPQTTTTSTEPPSTATSPAITDVTANTRKPYTLMVITAPADQATFQNERAIPVTVKLSPDLQKDDKVQLYVDSQPYGSPAASTQLTTGQLERGAHTLTATVIDKHLVTLKNSNTVTIYVQYARLGNAQ